MSAGWKWAAGIAGVFGLGWLVTRDWGDGSSAVDPLAGQAKGNAPPAPGYQKTAGFGPPWSGEATASDEDVYLGDLSASAEALYLAVPDKLRTGSVQFLAQRAANDPYWTDANVAKRDLVKEYALWRAELDHLTYQWQKGLDSTGLRPIHTVTMPGTDQMVTAVDNDFLALSQQYEDDLRAWSKTLVDGGVVPAADAPPMNIRTARRSPTI